MDVIDDIKEALVAIETGRLIERVTAAVGQGVPAKDILDQGLIGAMEIIGDKMESGDMFIPEVLMCAHAMNDAIAILQPFLSAGENHSRGKVLIGTVKGDLHDIGKDLVALMLASGGFEVINLGINVAPETFAASVREHRPHILALSALLTTTMPMMKGTVDHLQACGCRSGVRIIIGGAPVNREFATAIGADGYAPDAGGAVKLAKSLLMSRQLA